MLKTNLAIIYKKAIYRYIETYTDNKYIESHGKMRFGTIWATDHNDDSREVSL